MGSGEEKSTSSQPLQSSEIDTASVIAHEDTHYSQVTPESLPGHIRAQMIEEGFL